MHAYSVGIVSCAQFVHIDKYYAVGLHALRIDIVYFVDSSVLT